MKELFQEIDRLKDKINSYRPFEGELLKQLRSYYKIGLTYTSNALEGNSLTETGLHHRHYPADSAGRIHLTAGEGPRERQRFCPIHR